MTRLEHERIRSQYVALGVEGTELPDRAVCHQRDVSSVSWVFWELGVSACIIGGNEDCYVNDVVSVHLKPLGNFMESRGIFMKSRGYFMKSPGNFMKRVVKWLIENLLRSRAPTYMFMNF